MGILRQDQRNFHGPLTPCIFHPPSRPPQTPPQQHEQRYAQLVPDPAQKQSHYHTHPGWQAFLQQQQQQQQSQPPHATPPNLDLYQDLLVGQQPPQQQQQQQFTQHDQLFHHGASNLGINHAPFLDQQPAQQQNQPAVPNHSTYHTHQADQLLAQQGQHSELECRSAQNQGYYNGQHSGQTPAQQQHHQHSKYTYRAASSQSYSLDHLYLQLPAQQQQHNVQQHAQPAAHEPYFVTHLAPLISQDLFDLAWAAKLRSEQQQNLTIQCEGLSPEFEIVTGGAPSPSSEPWNPVLRQTVIKALDEASNAAEAAIHAPRDRDGPVQQSAWINGPGGARILKCFWLRGKLYVQPEDGYMFYRYGRWRRREDDVPVSMEVGAVICGCFQRDGEFWVQEDPKGEYRRYGFEDEI